MPVRLLREVELGFQRASREQLILDIMNNHSSFERGAMLAVVAVVCFYLAGYSVLRMQCSGSGRYIVVSPKHMSQQESRFMISFYKPRFHAESRLTGHRFYKWPIKGRSVVRL